MPSIPFPAGFTWGVATSAYQIEGAVHEGGRGESIWDRFARVPGAIEDRSDGSVACDHFHRWEEDVELLRRLGVQGYRFSVAWPRVLPTGRGQANLAGLDFYDRLVDRLLGAGIRPMLTLDHWDLPQALQDEGGWASRSTADAFVAYAEAVSLRLGDRVRDWVTHNEPWCIAMLGYEQGIHAPGVRDPIAAHRAAHHLLLSHGWALPVLRRNVRNPRVGIVLNLVPGYPASPSPADADACRRFDALFNRWYLDPLYRGCYPAEGVDELSRAGKLPGGEMPWVENGDMRVIAAPTDFLGVNYYSRAILRSDRIPEAENAPRTIQEPSVSERTEMGWEVFPQGLEDLLVRLMRDYAPGEVVITENGVAFPDPAGPDGTVQDGRRIAFLRDHLAASRRAIDAGVPLTGYYAWTLIDNFEWQHGYTKRFGLVSLDPTTLARIPKQSALWYAGLIAGNAIPDEVPTRARSLA